MTTGSKHNLKTKTEQEKHFNNTYHNIMEQYHNHQDNITLNKKDADPSTNCTLTLNDCIPLLSQDRTTAANTLGLSPKQFSQHIQQLGFREWLHQDFVRLRNEIEDSERIHNLDIISRHSKEIEYERCNDNQDDDDQKVPSEGVCVSQQTDVNKDMDTEEDIEVKAPQRCLNEWRHILEKEVEQPLSLDQVDNLSHSLFSNNTNSSTSKTFYSNDSITPSSSSSPPSSSPLSPSPRGINKSRKIGHTTSKSNNTGGKSLRSSSFSFFGFF